MLFCLGSDISPDGGQKQSGSSSTIVPSPDAQTRDPSVLSAPASLPDEEAPIRKSRPPTPDESKGQTRFAKTLRLTSDQLVSNSSFATHPFLNVEHS